MGVYSEYLGQQLSFDQLSTERQKQLKKISELRRRDIVVYRCSDSVQRFPHIQLYRKNPA